MKITVIGGAGYIGSCFVWDAKAAGHTIQIIDNLSTGHRALIPSDVRFDNLSLLDPIGLKNALVDFQADAVVHYAAKSLVGESRILPETYYQNNVTGTLNLLNALASLQTPPVLVFSSSSAVYGISKQLPIIESSAKSPISPYGRSKLACEFLIEDFVVAKGLKAIALRYFNAAGAHENGKIGECHDPETHLIPCMIEAVDQNKPVKVFGNTYDTKDGTCVRDYIHVQDLASAHLFAINFLHTQEQGSFTAMNLGTGQGYSVMEMILGLEQMMKKKVNYEICEPRLGDPSALYADVTKMKDELKFYPSLSSLENILKTAMVFYQEKKRSLQSADHGGHSSASL